MALAFDASHVFEITSTGSDTFTPVGTPKGIFVGIGENLCAGDVISGVTYGGVAMSRVCFLRVEPANNIDGGIYGYFLGASIPTGSQTVAVTVGSGTTAKAVHVISVTAGADTELAGTTGFATSSADSGWGTSFTMTVTGITGASFGFSAIWSQQNTPASVTVGSGETLAQSVDFGTECSRSEYTTTELASGDQVLGWGDAGQDAYTACAVAIQEIVTTNIKTFNGLANASVKTWNGLARASVKTFNGLG